MNYERLLKICEEKGETVSSVIKKMGIDSSNTGSWKNGGNPSVKILIKLSEYLNASSDYLLGLTDTPKPNMSFSGEEQKIISAYRNQPPEAQAVIRNALGIKDDINPISDKTI